MFDPEKLLTGMLGSGLGFGWGGDDDDDDDYRKKKYYKKNKYYKSHQGMFGSMLGSGTSTALKMGALGVAIAAFDHFMEQRKGGQPGAQGSWTPGMGGQPGGQQPGNWYYGPQGQAAPTSYGGATPPPPPGAQPMSQPAPIAQPSQPVQAQSSSVPSASLQQHDAVVLIQAMVAAANADGMLDADERQRIVGRLESLQLSNEERAFVADLLFKPPTMEQVADRVKTPELAQQVYAASLLSIMVDTDQERKYLADLAQRLNLDAATVQNIHTQLGIQAG